MAGAARSRASTGASASVWRLPRNCSSSPKRVGRANPAASMWSHWATAGQTGSATRSKSEIKTPEGHPMDMHARIRQHFLASIETKQRAMEVLIPHIEDRKSTRLNSSHVKISYAVFCLKKKKTYQYLTTI